MPQAIQWVTYLVPARYFVTILKGIYLKGVGVEILAGQIVLLVIFGAVALLVAQLTFHKKLE
jgi:ABC-2 type transport system permease protein